MVERVRLIRAEKKGALQWSLWSVLMVILAAVLLLGLSLTGCSGSASGPSDGPASQGAAGALSSSAAKGKLVEIKAEYDGPTAAGTVIDSDSDITVYGVYENGSTEVLDGWKVKKKVKLQIGKCATVTVAYKKLSTEITVEGDVPSEYLSAVNKAQSYVDMMHMSKAGLYDQLTSEYGEGFSSDAAEYAVNHVDANWKANALAKARDYRDTMSMSPSAVRDQLTSEYGEKFTQEEADYAIEHLDDDSTSGSGKASGSTGGGVPKEYQTALKKAQSYVDTMHMSKAGLFDQLTSEYGEQYSAEAAQYAVDNVDADWKANALAKAHDYRETMSMSSSAIYDQLTSEYGEKFTQEEADYAIAHLDD